MKFCPFTKGCITFLVAKVNIHVQLGGVSQCPVALHLMVRLPPGVKPASHMYVAVSMPWTPPLTM